MPFSHQIHDGACLAVFAIQPQHSWRVQAFESSVIRTLRPAELSEVLQEQMKKKY